MITILCNITEELYENIAIFRFTFGVFIDIRYLCIGNNNLLVLFAVPPMVVTCLRISIFA